MIVVETNDNANKTLDEWLNPCRARLRRNSFLLLLLLVFLLFNLFRLFSWGTPNLEMSDDFKTLRMMFAFTSKLLYLSFSFCFVSFWIGETSSAVRVRIVIFFSSNSLKLSSMLLFPSDVNNLKIRETKYLVKFVWFFFCFFFFIIISFHFLQVDLQSQKIMSSLESVFHCNEPTIEQ